MKRQNLAILAAYLEGLPKNYKHFEMRSYIAHEGTCEIGQIDEVLIKDPAAFYSNCGAVACAVGHGPAAGLKIPSGCINPNVYRGSSGGQLINWESYAEVMFNVDDYKWGWMFSGDWSNVDDSHRGAAARIRYVLAGKTVPAGKDSDIDLFTPQPEHVSLYKEFRV